jgi:hypothetical protein
VELFVLEVEGNVEVGRRVLRIYTVKLLPNSVTSCCDILEEVPSRFNILGDVSRKVDTCSP